MPDPADFNPFPGLRPFEAVENHLFFGREEQVDDLIRRLGQNRFLAVVGSSGSGKSSLVRAGLLPALVGGQLSSAGSDWRMAIFRPGSDPIGNLNLALGCHDKDVSPSGVDLALHLQEAVLRKSSFGLIEATQQLNLADSENLLVVVDQFEEIFRFARLREKSASDDAAAFVKLLLDSPSHARQSIYVVITMRSDFLGDCALFEDLPEILNTSQYLVPRMTRDQRRAAIAGPVAVGGARISQALLQRILNEVGSNPDQLPLMQHALMRTWEHWKSRTGGNGPIEVEDYVAVGSLANALSTHAEEAWLNLAGDRSRLLAEKIFKCLTEIGSDNRERRRPTTLSEAARVTGAPRNELIPVINEFRAEHRSFLTPSPDNEIEDDTVIDISHESLIRNWDRLWHWCREEAGAAEMYRRLSDAASRHATRTGGLWSDPELALALQWRERNDPNRAWSERYDESFDKTIRFLDQSLQAREAAVLAETRRREKERRAAYRTTAISLAAVVVLALLTAYALRQTSKTKILSRQLNVSSATMLSKRPGQEYEAMAAAIEGIPDDFPSEHPQASVLNALIGSISAARFSLPLIHPLDVRGGVFSPDGKHISTMCEDGTANLWEAATGRLLGSWKGQHVSSGHWPAAPVFSPDSKLAVFTNVESKVLIVDVESGHVVRTADAGTSTDFSGFAPADETGQITSTVLTVSSSGDAALWDAGTWNRLREFQATDVPLAGDHYAVFSRTGHLVLIWGRKGDARVLSVADGEVKWTFRLQPQGILEADMSSDGSRVVMLDNAGTTRLFDVAAGKEAVEKKAINACLAPRFSPAGDYLLCLHEQTIRLIGPDFKERSIPETPDKSHTADLISAAFSADGQYIVSASHDETARVWSTASGRLVKTLTGHTDAVEAAAFSDDGQKVLSVSLDNTARIWNWQGYSLIQGIVLDDGRVPLSPVRAVAVSNDGKEVYVGHDHADLEIWKSLDGTPSGKVRLPPQCMNPAAAKIESILPTPAGDSLITISGTRICLLNAGTRQIRYALALNDSPVRRVVFSADGSRLLTVQDNVSKLWDARTGTFVRDIGEGHIFDGVFGPSADSLFTVSKEGLLEWDKQSGSFRRLRGVFPPGEQPEFARFSSTARYIVTNDPKHGLRLWTLEDQKIRLYRQASGFWGPQTTFAFSPDETAVAGIRGHNAQLWPFAERDRPVTGLTFHISDVLGAIFSPGTQSLILTFGADNLAWLWGNDGTAISELRGHLGPVDTAAFFPDSKHLITGSEDGTARIFPSDLRSFAIESACGICDLLQARPEYHDLAECRRLAVGVCAARK